jgi:hypothetical protein
MTTLYPFIQNLRIRATLLLLCGLSVVGFAQTFTGDVVFTTQAEIDSFIDGGDRYDRLEGDLTLRPAAGQSFTNYSNFSELETITGSIFIQRYGLDNTQPAGNPTATFNSLNTLGGLEVVGSDPMNGNPGLTSISLPITTLNGPLRLINNTEVVTVLATQLTSIAGDFQLINNSFTSIAFDNVVTIGGRFVFDNNDVINSLDGLRNLETIGTDLIIRNNDNLNFINRLTSNNVEFTTLDTLLISGNPSLGSLGSGFGVPASFLQVNVTGALIIRNNLSINTVGQEINTVQGNMGSPLSEITLVGNPLITDYAPLFSGNQVVYVNTFTIANNSGLNTSIGQNIRVYDNILIADNPLLPRLPNFGATVTLSGDLTISNNAGLRQTTRLNNLARVDGDIVFRNNDAITPTSSINAPVGASGLTLFRRLTNAKSLVIDGNDGITTLDDLSSGVSNPSGAVLTIDSVFIITNNASLGDCCAPTCQTIVNGQQFDGTNPAVTVSNNTGDCVDKVAIVNACVNEPGKSCLIAAPVEFIAFTGQLNGSYVELNWATATESENDYFQVERSNDGINFVALGQVAGSGDSQQELDYSYFDYDFQAGVNYYRLRQVDYDGTQDFSDVIAVDAGGAATALGIYPNPASGSNVNVSLDNGWNQERLTLDVFSASGQHVFQLTSANGAKFELPSDRLSPGMYAVRVTDGARTLTERLVVR